MDAPRAGAPRVRRPSTEFPYPVHRPDPDAARLPQRDELVARAAALRVKSQWGGVFYAFAWAVIAGFGGAFGAYPLAASAVLLAFLALAAARIALRPGSTPAEAAKYLRRAWALVLASAALLGAISAWALLDPLFEDADMVVLLCVISLGTAFAQVYGADRRQAYLGTAMISLPSLLIEIARGEAWGVVVTLAFHYLYLAGLIVQVHREDGQRRALEQALRTERDRFEAQSRTDPLTGLANRRSFEHGVRRWLQGDGARACWMLVIDLDHFKRINDTHGHPAGDAALRHVADVLRARLAEREHLLARLGGEEFGVLFRADDVESAMRLANALRMDVGANPLPLPGGERVAIGLSGGLVRLDGDDARAYRAADAALYRAKAGGRGRIEVAAADPRP